MLPTCIRMASSIEELLLLVYNTTQNISYNFSLDGIPVSHQEIPWSFLVTLTLMYVLLFLAVILGNIGIIYLTMLSNKRKTVSSYFSSCMAITDILIASISIPFTKVFPIFSDHWVFGSVACSMVQYLQWALTVQKSFSLIAVTCDRYVIVLKPLRRRISKRKALYVIFTTYILASIVSYPSALTSKVVHLVFEDDSGDVCTEIWPSSTQKRAYSCVMVFLQFLIPLALMVSSGIHMAFILIKDKVPGEADPKKKKAIASSKTRSVKIMVTMIFFFIFSWMPIQTFTLAVDGDDLILTDRNLHIMWMTFEYFSYTNCISNPILYFFVNHKYRNGYKRLFLKLCQRKKKTSHQEMTLQISAKTSNTYLFPRKRSHSSNV